MYSILRTLAAPLSLLVAVAAPARAEVPSYEADIQPIFDAKCVSCHACYDSPCQLNLSDSEGLLRGASPTPVYGVSRMHREAPTRLYEDGQTASQWQDLGFTPVVGADAASSLLWAAIEQGTALPFDATQPPPDDLDFSLARANTCPSLNDYQAFSAENPKLGMPYVMARLTPEERVTIKSWLDAGAPIDTRPPQPSPVEAKLVDAWEAFLNQDGDRERLVARYLYEHWYLADVHFVEAGDAAMDFRLVRSTTPPGHDVERVHTRFPNDEPGGVRAYYRLVPERGTKMRKNRLPMAFSAAYLEQLETDFLGGVWTTSPGSADDYWQATNPFIAFADIPQEVRYRFLLDHAHYFIGNFIRGPVCRGPIALNVIEDRFFVAFLDPAYDLNERFVTGHANLQELPGPIDTASDFTRHVARLGKQQRHYLRAKDRELGREIPGGRTLDMLWDGNDNARLTVYRHRDSATVVRGWEGTPTDTLWVMDYSQLERTYYNLVANFDVFGTVFHQAATRLYFDWIRAESEDNFLLFLPPEDRSELRTNWYRGLGAREKQWRQYVFAGEHLPAATGLTTDDPKGELMARLATLEAVPTTITAEPLRADLLDLVANPQPVVRHFPEMTVVHVVVDGSVQNDQVITLLRDRAHTNTAFVMGENRRMEPERDEFSVADGVLGDYPNRIFRVPQDRVDAFFEQLSAMASPDDYRKLVMDYAVLRTSPDLADEAEFLFQWERLRRPLETGRFDLFRYGGELQGPSTWQHLAEIPRDLLPRALRRER